MNYSNSYKLKLALKYGWLVLLLALPVILMALPIDYFDSGETVCVSQSIFGLECPGCGITRSIMHLIHGDLEGAIDYNVFVLLIFPVLALLWIREILRLAFNVTILKGL